MKYYEYKKREVDVYQENVFNEELKHKILMRIGLYEGKEFTLLRSCPDLNTSEFMAEISEELLSNLSFDSKIQLYDDTTGSILMINPKDVQYISLEKVFLWKKNLKSL